MKKIHSFTTLAIGCLLLFIISFSIVYGILIYIGKLQEWMAVMFAIMWGIGSPYLIKEAYKNAFLVQKDASFIKKLAAAIVICVGGIGVFVCSLLAYALLTPLYGIVFIGYLLGLGMKAAQENDD